MEDPQLQSFENSRPRIIFVTGAPGTGKGTQCAILVEEFGFKHISIGDLMRAEIKSGSEEGQRIIEIVQSGNLVPKELTVSLLLRTLSSLDAHTVLLDGFPRSIDQAVYLEQSGLPIDFILHFDTTDEKVLLNRLIERGKTSGRADDNEETITNRFMVYKAESMPVLELYKPFGVMRIVESIATLPEVFHRTVCALRPELVCIAGPKLSGKTCLAEELAKPLYFHYMSLKKIIKVKINGRFMRLTNDEEIARQVVASLENLKTEYRVVLDGFPMNGQQARLFSAMYGNPNKVVFLNSSREVSEERLRLMRREGRPIEFSKIFYKSLDEDLVKFYRANIKGDFIEVESDKSFREVFKEVYEALRAEVVMVRGKIKKSFLKFLEKEGYKLINGLHLMKYWKDARRLNKSIDRREYADDDEIVEVLKKSIYSGNGTRKFAIYNVALRKQSIIETFEKKVAKISKMYYLKSKDIRDPIADNFYFKGVFTPINSDLLGENLDTDTEQTIIREIKSTSKQEYSQIILILGPTCSGKSSISSILGYKVIDFSEISEETKARLSTEDEPIEELTFSQIVEGVKHELAKTAPFPVIFDGLPPLEILLAKDPLDPIPDQGESGEEAIPLAEDPNFQSKVILIVKRLRQLLGHLQILTRIYLECSMPILEARVREKLELGPEDEMPVEAKNELLESWVVSDQLKEEQLIEGFNIPEVLNINTEERPLTVLRPNLQKIYKRQVVLVESENQLGENLIKKFVWENQVFFINFEKCMEEASHKNDELSRAVREKKLTSEAKSELLKRKMEEIEPYERYIVIFGYLVTSDEYKTPIEELVCIERAVGELKSMVVFTEHVKDLSLQELPVSPRKIQKKNPDEDEDDKEDEEEKSEEEKIEEPPRPMWNQTSFYQFFHTFKGNKSDIIIEDLNNLSNEDTLDLIQNQLKFLFETENRVTLQFSISTPKSSLVLKYFNSQSTPDLEEFEEPLTVDIQPLNYRHFVEACLRNDRARHFHSTQLIFPSVPFYLFFEKFKEILEEEEITITRGLRKAIHQTVDTNKNLLVDAEEVNKIFNILENPAEKGDLLELAEELNEKERESAKVSYKICLVIEKTEPAPVTNIQSLKRGDKILITPEGLPDSPRFCADRIVLFGKENRQIINDVVFHSSETRLKDCHFQVQAKSDGYYIVDNGEENGLSLKLSDNPVTLVKDSVISIGEHEFFVVTCRAPISEDDLESFDVVKFQYKNGVSPDGKALLQLEFISKKLRGLTYEFGPENKVVSIGSSSSNQIVLSGINSVHAKIELTPAGWAISDNFSAYGTFIKVNSYSKIKVKKPSDPLLLSHNSLFKFLGYEFRVLFKSFEELAVKIEDFISVRNVNFFEYYTIESLSGRGDEKEVFRCYHRILNKVCSVKIIPESQIRKSLESELEILKTLDHPNIIRVLDAIMYSGKLFIVSEFCKGGEVFEMLVARGSLTEERTVKIARQILQALSYLHSKGIVHNDISPQNVLFVDSEEDSLVKLIDFDSARSIKEGPLTEILGTPLYLAPEVLKKKYTEKRDIWALGVMLYILITGSSPFEGKSEAEILDQIKKTRPKFDEEGWEGVSSHAKRVVRWMLTAEADRRPSAKDLLADPWVKGSLSFLDISKTTHAKAFENFKQFYSSSKLYHAILMFMSTNLMTSESKQEMSEVFLELDENEDGFLSVEEIKNGMEKVNLMVTEDELDELLKEIDADEDGRFNYSEFLTAFSSKKEVLQRENLEKVFEIFDADGSGEITTEEIKKVLGNSETVWRNLVTEIDANKDGKIDIKEFKNLMLTSMVSE